MAKGNDTRGERAEAHAEPAYQAAPSAADARRLGAIRAGVGSLTLMVGIAAFVLFGEAALWWGLGLYLALAAYLLRRGLRCTSVAGVPSESGEEASSARTSRQPTR